MFDAEPEGWEQTTFGEIISLEYGRALPETSRLDGDVPVYGSNGPVGFHAKSLVGERGIVVGRKGTAGSVHVTEGAFWPIDTTYYVRSRQEVDFDWLAATLRHADLGSLNEATGVPGLNRENAYRQPVLLPPFDEQRRIAEVLRSADQAILTAEEVTNRYGAVIQREADSVIERLLTDEAVNSVKLGEIAKVRGGKRLLKGSGYEESPTGNPYVRVTDWNDYEISPATVRWISNEVASPIRRYTISSRDLFISIAGSIGLVASVPAALNGAYLTENAAKIVFQDAGSVDLTYLLVALRSEALPASPRAR